MARLVVPEKRTARSLPSPLFSLPLLLTLALPDSRSTLSNVSSHSSVARMPVSSSNKMIARSRRWRCLGRSVAVSGMRSQGKLWVRWPSRAWTGC